MQSGDVSRAPGDGAAEANMAPGADRGPNGSAAPPCPFETKHRGMARGGGPAWARGARFISCSHEEQSGVMEQTEQREQQQIWTLASLFVPQQRACDILLQPDGQRLLQAPPASFCSPSRKDDLPRCKD